MICNTEPQAGPAKALDRHTSGAGLRSIAQNIRLEL